MRVTEFIFTGLNFSPQLQVCLFLLSEFLPHQPNRELGYDYSDIDGFPPSWAHVLFPQSLVFRGHVVSPRILSDFFVRRKAISFRGCAWQQGCFGFFTAAEGFLWRPWPMTSVSASVTPCCIPSSRLRDSESSWWWVPLSSGSWTPWRTHDAFRLPFCSPSAIHCFLGDLPPLLSLVRADTSLSKWVVLVMAGAAGVFSGLPVLDSCLTASSPSWRSTLLMGDTKPRLPALHIRETCLSCLTLFYLCVA